MIIFKTFIQLKEGEEGGKVMVSRLSCAFDEEQLNLALEDSRKSAIASIRTNAIGGNNGMPAVVEDGDQLNEQDEKKVMLILTGIFLLFAFLYFLVFSSTKP